MSLYFKLLCLSLVSLLSLSIEGLLAHSVVDKVFQGIEPPTPVNPNVNPNTPVNPKNPNAKSGNISLAEFKNAQEALPHLPKEDPNQISDTQEPASKDPHIDKKIVLAKLEWETIQEELVRAIAVGDYDRIEELEGKLRKLEDEIKKLESEKSGLQGSVEIASRSSSSGSKESSGSESDALATILTTGAVAAAGPIVGGLFEESSTPSAGSAGKEPPPPYAGSDGNVTIESLSEYLGKLQSLESEGNTLADDGRPIHDAMAEVERLLASAQAHADAFMAGRDLFLCEGSGVRSCGINHQDLMQALARTVKLTEEVEELRKRLEDEPNNLNLRETFEAKRSALHENQMLVIQYRDQFNQRASSGSFAEVSMAKNSSDLINAVIEAINEGQLSNNQKDALFSGSFDNLARSYRLFGIQPIRPQSPVVAANDLFNRGSSLDEYYPRIGSETGSPLAFSSGYDYSQDLRGGWGDNVCLRNC